MTSEPRVALFCETFHEINGVALTARQLVAYAQRHKLPLLAVHGGTTPRENDEGSVRRVELKRAWASVPIECDLKYDFFFWRYVGQIREEVKRFQPDVIHITSPGELGQLGVYLSRELRIPLVASWHTNFHQFAARRLQKLLRFLPARATSAVGSWTQDRGLGILLWFYGFAAVTLAPTVQQVEWLEEKLKRPSFLMPRGVDSEMFHPKRRTENDGKVRLGFVGRVSPEKGVRLLRKIELALEARGIREFEIIVVGDGSEKQWLERRLKNGVFAGVLRGEELARAYANMDVFVFPSRTDTFGNVIQEAAASRVPAVVTNEGGPRHLVVQGVTGYVAGNDAEFVARVVKLAGNGELRRRMGLAARERVAGISWDAAFDLTYKAYRHCQGAAPDVRRVVKKASKSEMTA